MDPASVCFLSGRCVGFMVPRHSLAKRPLGVARLLDAVYFVQPFLLDQLLSRNGSSDAQWFAPFQHLARTVLGRNLFTRSSTYLNFDIFIHGPHHRHPRIAHNQLGNKMKDYIERNPDQEFPLFSTYVHATGQMVPFLFKKPGVGMNVGGPPPSAEKDQDVQNFVADVAEEVLT